jgi:YjbE family integral membrane protein
MELDAHFWLALLQIIGINIILSGDNAVVIALACRALPPGQQKWGIILGAGAAVVLRIIFTIFIVYLMTIPYLKIAGGLLLFYIGYKLMMPQDEGDEVEAAKNLRHAVQIVVIADMIMSLDNVIAVAAAAKGDIVLLVIGLVISIPLVVYGATLLIKLIEKYPVIVPGGAALIGFIGGEVVISDPAVEPWINAHAHWCHDVVPLLTSIAVVLVGRIVAPTAGAPRPVVVAEEAAGAAAFGALRLAFIVIGEILVARAPMIISFAVSIFGYVLAEPGPEAAADAAADPMVAAVTAIRPIFAAAIAVAIGEVVAWAARRAGRGLTHHAE